MPQTSPKPPLPSELSHYTTLEGLMGIVGTGTFWASNVSFLNDRRELLHGIEASLSAIEVLTSQRVHRQWHAALKEVAEDLRKGLVPNTYATCFCRRPDVLSQWRGYGGGEQGISVAFRRVELTRALKPDEAHLRRVIYADYSTKAKFERDLRAEIDELSGIEDIVGELSNPERRKYAYEAICGLIPVFKHIGFQDEREFRYVVQHDDVKDNVCFRVNRNVIVPYIKIGPADLKPLPISSVTIGPGREQELTQRSVGAYLAKFGYSTVNVKLSRVPFRS